MNNKMNRKIETELISLNTKEILLNFIDANVALFDIFDRARIYKKPVKSYWSWRKLNKSKFTRQLHELKRQKVIDVFVENKERYIELTEKGVEKLKKFIADDLKITLSGKWDKKWRVIIFDIPNKKKSARDAFRKRLKQIGFFAIQESVFIFPFDCKAEVDYFKNLYFIKSYVLYLLVETLESEVDIFGHFLDKGILNKKMI